MKALLVVMGLCALALTISTKSIPKKYKIDDKVFIEREKKMLELFAFVAQPTYDKDLVTMATEYDPLKHTDLYTHPEFVTEFMYYFNHDMLPKGEVFSIFFYEHLKQAMPLCKMMYSAKDFDTFYKTAVWARHYVNEGMWLYTVSVAMVHREDTYGMILPPIYEIYPFYFFNSEVINKAQEYKQMYHGEEMPKNADGYQGYTIESEYTGNYLNLHPEQFLSYFHEDVGLNAYYYYYNIFYPYWLGGEECKLKNDRRGEMYYYVHQQLLARYYLERLSNGYGEITMLNANEPIETGYYPSLEYPNGLDFPVRPTKVMVNQNTVYNHPQFSNYTNSYTYMMDFARRIRDAIDMGYIITHDGKKVYLYDEKGFETLGNMIEGNPDSPHVQYYGILQVFARHLLGYGYVPLNKYKLAPSALEHFETSLRDPVFYQMYKKIINLFQEYKRHVPRYTTKDLKFDGVKIENIKVDRLITYFDKFYSDLMNGVYYHDAEKEVDKFKVRVSQHRLNHKPFTYTINVDSDKNTDAVVRVFIGPKIDEYDREIDMNENRMNFFEIDKFMTTLKAGKNAVVRSSQQSYMVDDKVTFRDLYKRMTEALKDKEKALFNGSESYFGIPKRFLLPIGRTGGMTFQFYVIITPYDKTMSTYTGEETMYPMVGTGGFNMLDKKALGFPFDREIDWGMFEVPNSKFQDVIIYHKEMEGLNTTE